MDEGARSRDRPGDGFEEGPPRRAPESSEAPGTHAGPLRVDVEGFEGPLDLLLSLARQQKVDLTRISMLALAEQYLAFIAAARRLKLELAADYLVMAAWLTYMKSRLLLPEPETEEEDISGEEMAARLAFRLQRLEAMRLAADKLMARNRLGRDVFMRGMPEPVRVIARKVGYEANLYDLLKAYAEERIRTSTTHFHIRRLPVYAIEEARKRLESMLGVMVDWGRLDNYLPQELKVGRMARSALSSTLLASLELVREGHMEVRQLAPFGPIYVRRRERVDASENEEAL